MWTEGYKVVRKEEGKLYSCWAGGDFIDPASNKLQSHPGKKIEYKIGKIILAPPNGGLLAVFADRSAAVLFSRSINPTVYGLQVYHCLYFAEKGDLRYGEYGLMYESLPYQSRTASKVVLLDSR